MGSSPPNRLFANFSVITMEKGAVNAVFGFPINNGKLNISKKPVSAYKTFSTLSNFSSYCTLKFRLAPIRVAASISGISAFMAGARGSTK
jgi:hypothetical protein